MPANRNALLRYKTIDRCLSNPYRRWTLDDLIEACSEALREYEGQGRGVSRRTVPGDIQMMRSDRLGYNAPIEVYEGRYYRYADPTYSITRQPLGAEALAEMRRAVEVFAQFESYDFFVGITEAVHSLRDYLSLVQHREKPIIQLEQNRDLRGLHWLNVLYTAISNRRALSLGYKSFRSEEAGVITISPYLLKEYNNRWFLFGHHHTKGLLQVFALDRIVSVQVNSYVRYWEDENFDPQTYFDDVIGVTKLPGRRPKSVRLWVSREAFPYMDTKPLHHSQRVEASNDKGDHIVELRVVVNQELIARLLSYGPSVRVLAPRTLVTRMASLAGRLAEHYADSLEGNGEYRELSPTELLEHIGR